MAADLRPRTLNRHPRHRLNFVKVNPYEREIMTDKEIEFCEPPRSTVEVFCLVAQRSPPRQQSAQARQSRSAQAQPSPAGRKPNILFIMGDDIGWFNVSAYNMGIMGYRTPNIDRIGQGRRGVHRLVWPAELHRRPRGVHYWAIADPDRPDQGRPARCRTRPRPARSVRGRCHEDARLRHRPVRQEPSRRPQRASANGAWFR